MMTSMRAVALAAAVSVAAACESATAPRVTTLDDLVGNYTATSAVFTAAADAAVTHDVLGTGGTYILQIHPGGQYTTTLQRPGHAHTVRTGTLALNGDRMAVTEWGQPTRMVEFSLSGDVLTWHDMTDRFDFGGGDEVSRFQATLAR